MGERICSLQTFKPFLSSDSSSKGIITKLVHRKSCWFQALRPQSFHLRCLLFFSFKSAEEEYGFCHYTRVLTVVLKPCDSWAKWWSVYCLPTIHWLVSQKWQFLTEMQTRWGKLIFIWTRVKNWKCFTLTASLMLDTLH